MSVSSASARCCCPVATPRVGPWLLDNAPVSIVATYAYVNPVVALILGAVVLDETIPARSMVATAAIVGSVVVVVRGESARS